MQLHLENHWNFVHELRRESDLTGAPLHSAPATADVAELIDETFMNGVLADRLPPEPATVEVVIEPECLKEPIVARLAITLRTQVNGTRQEHTQRFRVGRWFREAQLLNVAFREDRTLAEGETAYSLLLALADERPTAIKLAPFQAPLIVDQSLEECGVRTLGAGELLPDRPLLVNQQFVEDAVRRCLEADTSETGGAVLGKIVRLREPLPNTQTRIVSILSASVDDRRHVGASLSFSFNPEALAEAAQIADLRGLGEVVQTVYHTHGWKGSCGQCNQDEKCPLAEANPSLQDYQLLESLFPGKNTLMPIAGRKLGAPGKRPVLQIHAWRGGHMQAIPWQTYAD